MEKLPLISVLTPTFNRGSTYLAETILRIQQQQEHGFAHEHIIVDNASTDNTEEVVRSFMKDDPRIKYFRNERNLYASGALNVAFQHSSGELIVPFDDDDIMPGQSLQARFNGMKNPKVQWTSGHALYIKEDRTLPGINDRHMEYYSAAYPFLDENNELAKPEEFFQEFFQGWLICGGTVTIRRKCIEEVGGWDTSFTAAQDTEMWIKLASKRYHYKLLNDYLFIYRLHKGQNSAQNARNGVWESLRKKLKEKYGIKS